MGTTGIHPAPLIAVPMGTTGIHPALLIAVPMGTTGIHPALLIVILGHGKAHSPKRVGPFTD